MSTPWLKLPKKNADTCKMLSDPCPQPNPSQRQIDAFLAKLINMGLVDAAKEIKHVLANPSANQSGGSKSRRLCAIVIVGLIATGGVVLTKGAVHEALIVSSLLPELRGTSFL